MFHSGLPSTSVYPFKEMTENESECAGIKHLNSLLLVITRLSYFTPSPPPLCFADLTSFTLTHYASGLCSTEQDTVQ